jgi:hypothetical protein
MAVGEGGAGDLGRVLGDGRDDARLPRHGLPQRDRRDFSPAVSLSFVTDSRAELGRFPAPARSLAMIACLRRQRPEHGKGRSR